MGGLHILRVVHVLAGAFWLGAVTFIVAFLFPAVTALGPVGGQVMEQVIQVRKASVALSAAAGLSLLSGLLLYGRDSGGFSGAWMRSGPGMVYGIGGLLAIVAAVVGGTVNKSAADRLAALAGELRAAGRPPTPEQQAQVQQAQGKLRVAGRFVVALLVLSASAMAVARYVP